MKALNKLKKIKLHHNFTQQQLAAKLNVSFQTVNSWLNGKSIPRKKHQELIDNLYFDLYGLEIIDLKRLEELKIEVFKNYDKNWINNINKSEEVLKNLIIKLTYHTNSIEGSTLTEADTEAIIFSKKVLANRTLIEQLEVVNHQKALYFAMQLCKNKNLQKKDILELHKLLMAGILENAGQFRNHAVRILGSFVPTANYLSIGKKLDELINTINKKTKKSILHIAKTHAIFEQIHPFSDGNGRVGRLLMLIVALKNGLPPVLVLQERKKAYYKYLQEAQLKENYQLLEYFICESILETTKFL
jgi:Fic family protein